MGKSATWLWSSVCQRTRGMNRRREDQGLRAIYLAVDGWLCLIILALSDGTLCQDTHIEATTKLGWG